MNVKRGSGLFVRILVLYANGEGDGEKGVLFGNEMGSTLEASNRGNQEIEGGLHYGLGENGLRWNFHHRRKPDGLTASLE